MSVNHTEFVKNFHTAITVNGKELPLNHFVQETLANMIVGFSKTLKELTEPLRNIEIKIKTLGEPLEVDAHAYP